MQDGVCDYHNLNELILYHVCYDGGRKIRISLDLIKKVESMQIHVSYLQGVVVPV